MHRISYKEIAALNKNALTVGDCELLYWKYDVSVNVCAGRIKSFKFPLIIEALFAFDKFLDDIENRPIVCQRWGEKEKTHDNSVA